MCVGVVCSSLAVIAIVLWSPAECQYHDKAKTVDKIKSKANHLMRELVVDAEMKIMAVNPYRDQYHRAAAFQLGTMVFDMRQKYKRMLYLYHHVDNNVRKGVYSQKSFCPRMLQCIHLSMEVENINLMIVEWQRNDENKDLFHSRMKSVMRSGQGYQREIEHELEPIERMRPGNVTPPPTSKRKNKKWRHISDRDFE
uniref:Secreted protein n=1 Tax=Heliothis virescens TaxID=7102 RepID=A0A2A4IV15_HELVI